MKVAEIAEYLQMPLAIATGLARAGFFGHSSPAGHFKRGAVREFEKHGVQWDPGLGRRLMPQGLDPVVPGWESPPLHTLTEFCISLDRECVANDDTHWVANFFFSPNEFCFPHADVCRRISPSGVRLREKFIAASTGLKVIVYPDRMGRLALIQVYGRCQAGRAPTDYLIEAKNDIVPVLNWLTLQTDASLPILQQHWVGLPSGNIHLVASRIPPITWLDPQCFVEHEPLRDAQSLYRLGLCSDQPMYAFLSFWRACEALDAVQAKWVARYCERFSSMPPFDELLKRYGRMRIPEHPVFAAYSGMKLNQAAACLKELYRNAIAHSHSRDGATTLTGSDEASETRVQAALPILRYVVKTRLDTLHGIFGMARELSRQAEPRE